MGGTMLLPLGSTVLLPLAAAPLPAMLLPKAAPAAMPNGVAVLLLPPTVLVRDRGWSKPAGSSDPGFSPAWLLSSVLKLTPAPLGDGSTLLLPLAGKLLLPSSALARSDSWLLAAERPAMRLKIEDELGATAAC